MTREEFEAEFEKKSQGGGSKKGGLSHGDMRSLAKRLVNAMDGSGTGHDEIEAVLGILNSHTAGKSSKARDTVFKRVAQEFEAHSDDNLSLRDALLSDYSEFSDWNIGGTDHDEDSILKAFGFAEDALWGDTSEKSDAQSTTEGLNVPNMDRYGPDGDMSYGRGEPELDPYEQYLEDEVFNKPESKVIDADAEPTPPAEPEYPEDADQMPDDSEFGVDTPPPGTADPGNGLPPREEGFEEYLTEEEPTPDSGHGTFPGDGAPEGPSRKPRTSSYVTKSGEIVTEDFRDVDFPEEPPPFPEPQINPRTGQPEQSIEALYTWQAQNAKYQQDMKREEADQAYNTALQERHNQLNRTNTTGRGANLDREYLRDKDGNIQVNPKTGRPMFETDSTHTSRVNAQREQIRQAAANKKALADFNNPQPDYRRAVTPSNKRNFDISDMPYETRIAYELANLKGAGKLIDQSPEPKFKPAGYGQEHLAHQKGMQLYDPFVPGQAQKDHKRYMQAKRELDEWNAKTSEQILAEADAAQEERMAADIRDKMGAGAGLKTKKFTGGIGSSAFGILPDANRSGSFHKGWTGAHVPEGPDDEMWSPEGIENLEGQMEIAGLIDGADEAAWEPEIPAGIDESELVDEPTRLPSGEILPPLPEDLINQPDSHQVIDAPDGTQDTIDSYMTDPNRWERKDQIPPLSSQINSADRLLAEMERDRLINQPDTHQVIDVPGAQEPEPPQSGYGDSGGFGLDTMGSSPDNMYNGPLMPFDASGPTNIYDGPLYEEEDEELQNTIDAYMNGEGWGNNSDYDPWNPGLGYSESFYDPQDPWNSY